MTIRKTRRKLQLLSQSSNAAGDVALAEPTEVSQETFKAELARKETVYVESGGFQKEIKIRLWDPISERYTDPLPQVTANLSIRKVSDKCTACIFTSLGVGGKAGLVESHIHQTVKKGAEHIDAQIQYTVGTEGSIAFCDSCDMGFRSRPANARTHVQKMIDEGEAHKVAKQVTIRRFLAEPPAVVAAAPVVAVATPLIRESRLTTGRRRRRSRGRKGKVTNA